MELKDLFHGIADLFENVLFVPYDALRSLELDSWWLANIFSWILIIVGMAAFVYWMLQLKQFDESTESTYTYEEGSLD